MKQEINKTKMKQNRMKCVEQKMGNGNSKYSKQGYALCTGKLNLSAEKHQNKYRK